MEPLESTLLSYLNQVPDFRHARGQRFAWSYLLALVDAAVAAGQWTVVAMRCWADAHRSDLLEALQPSSPRIPSPATWRRVLEHIDMVALEQQVAAHNQMLDAADPLNGRIQLRNGATLRGQAVDGKDVRGARTPSSSVRCGMSPPTSWAKPRLTARPTRSQPSLRC